MERQLCPVASIMRGAGRAGNPQKAGQAARGGSPPATLVIAVAVLKAIALYAWSLLRPTTGPSALERNRLSLGNSLTLGLEFLIGADILRTAVAPSWTDIG